MEVKINDKFDTLFKNPRDIRYYVITGGRGSSKSFSVATYALLSSFEAYTKILYTRYTMTSAKKSIIPEFTEKLVLLEAEEYFNVNNSDITNTTNNSEIIFSGIKTSAGNQTANLKSLQGISAFVLDEAEEMVDESEFDKIDLSVRTQHQVNSIILILNPATKEHWIYKRFFESRGVEEGFNGTKGNVCYIHTTYLDNLDNLSDSYIENIAYIKANQPDKYKYEIMGGWKDKAEGVIFPKWTYGKFDDSLIWYYGLDFGFKGDPDACVRVAIDNKRQKIYVEEIFYEYGQKIEQIGAKVKQLDEDKIIVADSAEGRLIEFLRRSAERNVYEAKKGPGSVLEGIKLIENFDIIVCGSSPNLVRELNNYTWRDTGRIAPAEGYDHLIDAMRYVVFMYARRDFKQPDIILNDSTDKKARRGLALGHSGLDSIT